MEVNSEEKLKEQIEKSILIPLLKWIIGKVSWLSIYHTIGKLKWKHPNLYPFWFTEVYVLTWASSVSIFFFLFPKPCLFLNILVCFSFYRLWDIGNRYLKMLLVHFEFDRDDEGHYLMVRNVGRLVLLSLINIYEIILCFGVFYLKWGDGFNKKIENSLTAFYQSIVTISTLGYGNIYANSDIAKRIVIFQLLYFMVIFVLVFPRIFSAIRVKEKTKERYETLKKETGEPHKACDQSSKTPQKKE